MRTYESEMLYGRGANQKSCSRSRAYMCECVDTHGDGESTGIRSPLNVLTIIVMRAAVYIMPWQYRDFLSYYLLFWIVC